MEQILAVLSERLALLLGIVKEALPMVVCRFQSTIMVRSFLAWIKAFSFFFYISRLFSNTGTLTYYIYTSNQHHSHHHSQERFIEKFSVSVSVSDT